MCLPGETAGAPTRKSLPAVQPESDQGRDGPQSTDGNSRSSSQTQHHGTTSAEQRRDNALEPASSSHPRGMDSPPCTQGARCSACISPKPTPLGGIPCSPCSCGRRQKGGRETIPVKKKGRLGQRESGRLGEGRRGLPVQGLVPICPGSQLGLSWLLRVWGYAGESQAPE